MAVGRISSSLILLLAWSWTGCAVVLLSPEELARDKLRAALRPYAHYDSQFRKESAPPPNYRRAEALLAAGDSLELQGYFYAGGGYGTVLHEAVYLGDVETIRFLLERGASVRVASMNAHWKRNWISREVGSTPLGIAKKKLHQVERAIECGKHAGWAERKNAAAFAHRSIDFGMLSASRAPPSERYLLWRGEIEYDSTGLAEMNDCIYLVHAKSSMSKTSYMTFSGGIVTSIVGASRAVHLATSLDLASELASRKEILDLISAAALGSGDPMTLDGRDGDGGR